MRMQRRSFLALTGGALLSAGSACRVPAQARERPKATRSKTFAPQKPGGQGNGFALIEERPGIKIYSTDADEIRHVVIVGEIEWVATATGMRRLDRKRNEMRIFSRGDGFPAGDVKRLVADENGAFALVKSPGSDLLCAYNPAKGRWDSFPVPAYQGSTNGSFAQEEDTLALSPTAVAYVPWCVSLTDYRESSPTPFAVFNRKTRKLSHAPWDKAIRPDQPDPEKRYLQEYLLTRFAAIVGETLYLGTQRGIFLAPLDTGKANPTWQNLHPMQTIRLGTLLPDGALALETVMNNNSSLGTLEKLDLRTGEATPLPDVNRTWQLLQPPIMRGGALWCIGTATSYPGVGVYRLPLLGGAAWESIAWQKGANPAHPDQIRLADEKTLPDPVAAALLCQLGEQKKNRRRMRFEPLGQKPLLQQRFWRWQSPDCSAELPPEFRSSRGAIPGILGLPDPKDPTQIWLSERGNFVRISRKELPAPVSTGGALHLPMTDGKLTVTNARRFPLVGEKVERRTPVSLLLSGGAITLALEPDGSIHRWGNVGGTTEVALPGRAKTPSALQGAVAGPGRTCFVWEYRSKSPVLRWDEKKQALIKTSLQSDALNSRYGSTKHGFFKFSNRFSSEQKTFPMEFLAVGADGVPANTWETIEPPLPARDGSIPNYIGSAADVLWFQTTVSEQTRLRTWNPESRRWSASETFATKPFRVFSGANLVESPDRMGWVYGGGGVNTLFGYAPEADRWETSALTERATQKTDFPQEDGFVVAATESAVWVACTDGTYRFDRAGKTWSKPESAQVGFVPDAMLFQTPRTCVPAGDGSWWLGSYEGTWRFDPKKGLWKEETQSAGAESRWFLTALVTDDDVWGIGNDSVLAHLNRKTEKTRLFGRESLPDVRSQNLGMRAGAGRCWVVGQSLHYFDAVSERFVPVTIPKPPGSADITYCPAVASIPGNPDAALILAHASQFGVVHRWERGRLDPTPLPQPPGDRYLYDLRAAGGSVYLAASDGIWRFVENGRWERILSGRFDGLTSDGEHPGVLWASSWGISTESGSVPSRLVRIEASGEK